MICPPLALAIQTLQLERRTLQGLGELVDLKTRGQSGGGTPVGLSETGGGATPLVNATGEVNTSNVNGTERSPSFGPTAPSAHVNLY